MSEDQVKHIKQSENFRRTQRNFLVSAATLVFFALADPEIIKIPGFTEEAGLPAPLAYIGLYLTVLYFFYEYFVEYTYTRAINLEASGFIDNEDVQRVLRDRALDITNTANDFKHVVSEFKSMGLSGDRITSYDEINISTISAILETSLRMTVSRWHLDGDSTSTQAALDAQIQSLLLGTKGFFKQQYEMNLQDYDSHRQRILRDIEGARKVISEKLPQYMLSIETMNNNTAQLIKSYNRLSQSIYASQRISFEWKDRILPWILLMAATVLPIIPMLGYDWAWHDWGQK